MVGAAEGERATFGSNRGGSGGGDEFLYIYVYMHTYIYMQIPIRHVSAQDMTREERGGRGRKREK